MARKRHQNDDEDKQPLIQKEEPSVYSPQDDEIPETLRKKPIKSILLAILLFVLGTSLLILGICIVSGKIQTQYSDRGTPLIIIGSLCFIPGAYYVYILVAVLNGSKNFSFDDFPEL